ncbi:MAG: sterol-binding protein [Gaiellaceae bacterium]|jgi:putative sterol carrier protein|nr:sterol-binding protein [Gaiellaceae bacterium]
MAKPRCDPTAQFFAKLAERSDEPLLRKAKGSMRFDVVDGRRTRRWLVTVDGGELAVSSSNAAASCVARVDKAIFDRVATGRLNVVAAVLRGDVAVEGDWRLLVRMQRLFPSPPRPRRRASG